MNLSEGLQLTFSCALSLFVCLGIARPRIQMETLGAALFYALLLVMVPTRLGYPLFQRIFGGTFHISVEFYKFIFFSVFLFALMIFTSDMAVFVSSRGRSSLYLHMRAPRTPLSIYLRSPECCF